MEGSFERERGIIIDKKDIMKRNQREPKILPL